jgi:hypothetical protein
MEPTDDQGDSMDTLTDSTRRLQADGYTANLYASDDSMLRCDSWPDAVDPETVQVDDMRRFEGQSDPADMVILFAITTQDGHRGLYTPAFNAQTPPEDAAVIKALRGRSQ